MKKPVLTFAISCCFLLINIQLYAGIQSQQYLQHQAMMHRPGHTSSAPGRAKDLRGMSSLLVGFGSSSYNGHDFFLNDSTIYQYSNGRTYSATQDSWLFDTLTDLVYDTTTAGYNYTVRYLKYFNVNGLDSIYLAQKWDTGTNAWLNTGLYVYQYNTAGYIDTVTAFTWSAGTGSWANYYRSADIYNGSNQPTQWIEMVWSSGSQAYEISYIENYAYDGSGDNTSVVGLNWNTVSLAFDSSDLYVFTYDATHDQTSEADLYYDSTTHVWQNGDMYLYSDFASTNNYLQELRLHWDNSTTSYDTFYEYNYTYNAYNFKLTYQVLDYAGGGSFVNESGDAVGRYYYIPDTTTSTGIATVNADGVKLYPNPSTGDCHLSLTSSLPDAGILSICDLSGRIVKVISLGGAEATFRTDDMTAGMYICTVSSGGAVISTKKLIVE